MLILELIVIVILEILLIDLAIKEEHKANNLLKEKINNLENNIYNKKSQIDQRNKLIKHLQEKNITLLNNTVELRKKVIDLENNIELLVNNLK